MDLIEATKKAILGKLVENCNKKVENISKADDRYPQEIQDKYNTYAREEIENGEEPNNFDDWVKIEYPDIFREIEYGLDENKQDSDNEAELDKLQSELRGVDVSKLSDEEYKEYKDKANKVHELIDKIYKIDKLGENRKVTEATTNLDDMYDEYKEAYHKDLDIKTVPCVIARDKMLSGWGRAKNTTHYQIVLCADDIEANNIASNMEIKAKSDGLANIRVDFGIKIPRNGSVSYSVGRNARAWNMSDSWYKRYDRPAEKNEEARSHKEDNERVAPRTTTRNGKEVKITEATTDVDEMYDEYKRAYGKDLDLKKVPCVIARDKMLSGWGGAEGRNHYQVVLCYDSSEAYNIAHNMQAKAKQEQLANIRVSYGVQLPRNASSAYTIGRFAPAWNMGNSWYDSRFGALEEKKVEEGRYKLDVVKYNMLHDKFKNDKRSYDELSDAEKEELNTYRDLTKKVYNSTRDHKDIKSEAIETQDIQSHTTAGDNEDERAYYGKNLTKRDKIRSLDQAKRNLDRANKGDERVQAKQVYDQVSYDNLPSFDLDAYKSNKEWAKKSKENGDEFWEREHNNTAKQFADNIRMRHTANQVNKKQEAISPELYNKIKDEPRSEKYEKGLKLRDEIVAAWKNKDLTTAYEKWSALFDLFSTGYDDIGNKTDDWSEEQSLRDIIERTDITDTIEDKCVYDVTDYGKAKAYKEMGY